jgi:hypothetical protein
VQVARAVKRWETSPCRQAQGWNWQTRVSPVLHEKEQGRCPFGLQRIPDVVPLRAIGCRSSKRHGIRLSGRARESVMYYRVRFGQSGMYEEQFVRITGAGTLVLYPF